ncbi:pyridoxamine 5'-phosphate oxidase [Amycolatopsis sp. CA-230715]|uniref:pyridoxamine 5'-phosphate oxidase n=1 Tax=Amycolatopsis sp. CA-230715 TaxID=2745196 RepID=UPI001C00FFB4|nr:pyridoxamine 5'-phosphate oxidase [Amycolatopsis sp. CA-230715]QWF80854.1 hypothetical protein HUW46_04279 [Amycolatopsis sp. CA-230715]
MSFVMSAEEREQYFSEVHVGVLAVSRGGRAPLTVPVWYDYEPGGEVLIWMHRDSVKDVSIRKAGQFSLLAQTETQPYKYVTAEGPVVANDEPPTREQALRIAGRYGTQDEAQSYVDGALGADSVLVRMRPTRWLSNDQSK